jgi:hypothetical protein
LGRRGTRGDQGEGHSTLHTPHSTLHTPHLIQFKCTFYPVCRQVNAEEWRLLACYALWFL